jgi:signal transduction histidine kinase
VTDAVDTAADALWASAAELLGRRASHAMHNALNAVALNVEVARSRAVEGEPADRIAPFATTAAAQVERLATRCSALLSFARAERAPADVARIIERLRDLLNERSSVDDAIVFTYPGGVDATTPVSPQATRTLIAHALLQGVPGAQVRCDVTVDGAIFVDVRAATDALDDVREQALSGLAGRHGIGRQAHSGGVRLTFPLLAGK